MSAERPADEIKALMDARGWSQTQLAYVLGVTSATVNQLVKGKRPVTPEMARLLEAALGCSAESLLEKQARWSLKDIPPPDPEVRSRALAESKYPLREMVKRGWISDPAKGAGAYPELCRFFGVNSLDNVAGLAHAARKTGKGDPTGEQLAWLYRVRAIAREMPTPLYSEVKLREAIDRMSLMREAPEETRHVARLMHECGVRFVVVQGLSGGNIDGVCTWLDSRSPVIGLSMRFDRIDNFWFVLIHECTHVLYRHGQEAAIIDEDIAPCDNSIDGEEKVANAEAAEFCVPSEKMRSFYLRKNPFFSHVDVQAFAKRNQIHPGLVVGQLHKMTGQYNLLRQYLVNVRKFVISTAMTDGWGNAVAVG